MKATSINKAQLMTMIESGETFLVDFWAPWCPHCRKISPAYDEVAEELSSRLPVVKLDMDEDDALWEELQVELIPTLRVYKDGKPAASTVAPESKAAIDAFLAPLLPRQEKHNDDHVYDMIIIGGGPGGYTAALYAARAGLDTLVLEKLSAGGQMALTQQIDNYPGFTEGVGGYELGLQMLRQAERFGAKNRSADVHGVNLTASPKVIESSEGAFLARTVVIATGATPRELGLPGEKELIGKGVAYCAACDGMAFKGKTVAVVGGGNSAAADALLLSRIAEKVIIIHRRDTLRATKVYHEPLMKAENVHFLWNSVTTELLHEDKLTGLRIQNVHTGTETIVPCDGVFVSIGRQPATALVEGQLTLENGYILAGETTETSLPGVYAVGDVRTKLLRQVVTAVSDGAVAVHMAEEYLARL